MLNSKIEIHSASITSETDPQKREFEINKFKSEGKETMVLCNYDILSEGFDAPSTQCVIIARPTTSLIKYLQMIGRGMRGEEVGGNSDCEIWTVQDPRFEFYKNIEQRFNNWEDLW